MVFFSRAQAPAICLYALAHAPSLPIPLPSLALNLLVAVRCASDG